MNSEQRDAVIETAVKSFKGDLDVLESAIGTLIVGSYMGWKPIILAHQRVTIRKYENILGVSFRDVLPESTALSSRMLGWRLVQQVSSFWKAARGELPGFKTPIIDGGDSVTT